MATYQTSSCEQLQNHTANRNCIHINLPDFLRNKVLRPRYKPHRTADGFRLSECLNKYIHGITFRSIVQGWENQLLLLWILDIWNPNQNFTTPLFRIIQLGIGYNTRINSIDSIRFNCDVSKNIPSQIWLECNCLQRSCHILWNIEGKSSSDSRVFPNQFSWISRILENNLHWWHAKSSIEFSRQLATYRVLVVV